MLTSGVPGCGKVLELALSNNALTGVLPESWGNLTQVECIPVHLWYAMQDFYLAYM